MSIPVWTYDERHYENLTRGQPFEIRTDPVKGKGLFATRSFEKGEYALVETAMCCTQNLDECSRGVPCCAHCLVSLESPRGLVCRATSDKAFAGDLPFVKAFNSTRKKHIIKCLFEAQGCSLVFCSYRCREAAWASFHFAGCRGCMTETGKQRFDEFTTASWQQAGIDYSDTHFLAFRFLAAAITRHRLHGLPMEAAYAQIGQLIRAPLHKFSFSFLLPEVEAEVPEGLTVDERRDFRWKRFLKYKEHPEEDPAVTAAAKEGGLTKEQMMQNGLAMLDDMFAWDAEEKAFFTVQRWSELLGAVLLNGQERTPNSPYVEYCQFAATIESGKAHKQYEKTAKDRGFDLGRCATSTKGQGIYPVGCLFNHSCTPNLQVQYTSENDESLVAICIRDIANGDELCISYIDESMHYYERQQQLFEHYLFNCRCTKCVEEGATVAATVTTGAGAQT